MNETMLRPYYDLGSNAAFNINIYFIMELSYAALELSFFVSRVFSNDVMGKRALDRLNLLLLILFGELFVQAL
jgi:hypothetical protein